MKNFGYGVFSEWDLYRSTACVYKITTQEEYDHAIGEDGCNMFSRHGGFECFYAKTIEEALHLSHMFPLSVEYVNLTDEDKLEIIERTKKMIADGTMAKNFPRISEREYNKHAIDMWSKVLLNKAVYTCDFDKLNEDLETKCADKIENVYDIKQPAENKTMFETTKDWYIKRCGKNPYEDDIRLAMVVIRCAGLMTSDYISIEEK